MQVLVVGVLGRFPVDMLELEERTGQLLDRDFASLRSVELVEASVAGFAGVGIGCKARYAVLGQGNRG